MRNPAPAIISAISSLWDRLNTWLGRSQAEQAKEQDAAVQQMATELEARAKEQTDAAVEPPR